MMNTKKNRIQPSVFTTTLLLFIAIIVLFNFNFDVFKAGAAPGPIFGEGTGGFIVKWLTTPPAPTAANTTVAVNNSNYCGAGVHATISWTYSDPNSSAQTAYEVQIDDDADPLSGQPEWESGTVSNSGTSANTTACPVSSTNTSLNSIASPQTACRMVWNTTYRAWVRVRNGIGSAWSAWTLMGQYVNGPACNGTTCPNPCVGYSSCSYASTTSWITPLHAFPQTGFTVYPSSPSVGSPVTFTDTTTFQGAATPRSWVWDFNYPTGPTQTINSTSALPVPNGNTTHIYSAIGTYSPRLTATDDIGQICSYDLNPAISIQAALPRWLEVAPR